MPVNPEHCHNCDRLIGRLEPAHVYRGEVVCEQCHAKLSGVTDTSRAGDLKDGLRTGIQPMTCPTCGKKASEYEPNKWQCVDCGRRFVYEPPRHPDQYVRIEQVSKFDDSSFFVCAHCGGKFPRHSHAEFVCKRCGKTFCQEHINKNTRRCKPCESAVGMIGCLIVAAVLAAICMIISLGSR
jgi:DNA-directed RNA polymerase subunit RPC12/RpoP